VHGAEYGESYGVSAGKLLRAASQDPRAAAHLPGFVRLLEETPEWLARRWPRITEYARTWRAAWRPTGSETETSLLSFALQEYEAASLRLDEPKRGGLPQRRGHEQLALKWAAKGLRVRR